MIRKIAKAELKTLFYSPIAWLILLVFMLQCTIIYNTSISYFLKLQGSMYARNVRSVTSSVFGLPFGLYSQAISRLYLYIPLLTMGLMTRETSSGTIKLLYSSPIKIKQIVFGKFLAMIVYNLLLILILSTLALAAIFQIQDIDYGLVFTGLLATFLLLSAYTAIGLFMSSLTSYQVVAAISTLAVFAILEYVGTIGQNIDFIRDLTSFLSISRRTDYMLEGLISTRDLAYFLLIVGMFIGFTVIKLNAERKTSSLTSLVIKYFIVANSVLIIGYMSSLPKLIGYLDCTATKKMTLTRNIQKMLEGMHHGPIKIVSYINLVDKNYFRGAPSTRVSDIARWEPYIRFKSDLDLQYIYYYDQPSSDQKVLEFFQGSNLKQIAEQKAKSDNVPFGKFKEPSEIRKIIDLKAENNGYVIQLNYNGRSTFLRIYDDQEGFPTEAEVGAALKRLTANVPVIAFLNDEFERNKDKLGDRDYGFLTSEKEQRYALVNQGFDVENLSLSHHDIPADISVLVIADPRINFSPQTLAKINAYVDSGGNLLIAGEPGKQEIVNAITNRLGVKLLDGNLVQVNAQNSADVVTPYISKSTLMLGTNLRSAYNDSLTVTMPGVAALFASNKGFVITPLLMTDEKKSWNKMGRLLLDSGAMSFNAHEGDVGKSFPTIIGMKRKINHKEQRIIVAGDADFLDNANLTKGNYANFVLGTDLFGWFTYGLFPVDVARPTTHDNKINLTDSGYSLFQAVYLGVFPGLLLLSGTLFLIKRKRK